MDYKFSDGGRSKYYKAIANDCVCRAIAIAARMDYKQVYNELMFLSKNFNKSIKDSKAKSHPRNGVPRKVYDDYIKSLGFTWVPTMMIGGGCTHHLKSDELPLGNLIVSVSKHMTCVLDKVIYDTHDPSRGQTRCVYGYYIKDWAMWRDERIELILEDTD